MIFKIDLRLDLQENTPDHREELSKFAQDAIDPICKGLGATCSKSIYHFHRNEVDEMRGIYQYGVCFRIEKQVRDAVNFHHFANIFCSLAELLGGEEEIFHTSVEFL